jgi:hypothetical protein
MRYVRHVCAYLTGFLYGIADAADDLYERCRRPKKHNETWIDATYKRI